MFLVLNDRYLPKLQQNFLVLSYSKVFQDDQRHILIYHPYSLTNWQNCLSIN